MPRIDLHRGGPNAASSRVLRRARRSGLGRRRRPPGAGRDDFTTIYDFPQEHWVHLRTSNPIESIFAGVRLRTDAAKRMRVRENALYLATRLSTNWRSINAPDQRSINAPNQLQLVLAGQRFAAGRLQLPPASQEETAT
ncbi:MAG: hypothetical protein ACREOA_00655 [Candidatus Dormibacteria bacterium]